MFTRIELNADIFAVWGRLADDMGPRIWIDVADVELILPRQSLVVGGIVAFRTQRPFITPRYEPSAMQGCKL